MKFLPSQLAFFIQNRPDRRNLKLLFRFVMVLLILIIAFAILFHLLMIREGRTFSWVTGFYWTITVMSILGFGDIPFNSDSGRFFTAVVLFSGMLFLTLHGNARKGRNYIHWHRRCGEPIFQNLWNPIIQTI